jgi:CheY-like chemotaxis protein
MTLVLILAVGHDPMLLDTQNSILRAAGYLVESASSIEQAIDNFRDGDFDLVVLCHSIPWRESDRLIYLIRASGSSIPIVSIAALSDHHPDTFPDVTVGGHPMKLMRDIERALNEAARRYHAPEVGVPASGTGWQGAAP